MFILMIVCCLFPYNRTNDSTYQLSVVDFYVLLLQGVIYESANVPHGLEGHFLLGADAHKSREFHQGIADALFSLGKIPSTNVVQLSREGAVEVFGPAVSWYF